MYFSVISRSFSSTRSNSLDPDGCNEFERVLLKDLEITEKYMLRVMGKSEDRRLKTPAFHAQANLLTAGILSQQQAFFDSVRKLHDRSGQAQSGVSAPPGGHEHTRDRAPSAAQPQHSAHDPQATGGHLPLLLEDRAHCVAAELQTARDLAYAHA